MSLTHHVRVLGRGQDRAEHTGRLSQELFDGAAMAFIGKGSPAQDMAGNALAKAARCPVNVVDPPELCDMTTPAIVDRDLIVVAIGCWGTARALSRHIKTRLERLLSQKLGGLVALARRLRPSIERHVPRGQRLALWAWVFERAPRAASTCGKERAAARNIKATIDAGAAPKDAASGQISLVGAGPGARDLLTLRAVERMQEADVIFYDRLVDKEVLELARRDAERVYVGKHVGAHAIPQDRINRMIVAQARQGKRVVRLKSGDPGIFGRATEEIEAARAADIPVEIVPGVTAATAAGAAMCQSLTQRDVSDVLVLATGTGCASDPLPDTSRVTAPGTTTAIYMGVRHAERLTTSLIARGLPDHTPVDIAIEVSKPGQHHLRATLSTLVQTLAENEITGCAVLIVRWPKHLANTRGRLSIFPGGSETGSVTELIPTALPPSCGWQQ